MLHVNCSSINPGGGVKNHQVISLTRRFRRRRSRACSGFCMSNKLPGGAGEAGLPDTLLSGKGSWQWYNDRSLCGGFREAQGFGIRSPALKTRLHHFPAMWPDQASSPLRSPVSSEVTQGDVKWCEYCTKLCVLPFKELSRVFKKCGTRWHSKYWCRTPWATSGLSWKQPMESFANLPHH